MKIIIELLINFWYLWLLIVIVAILKTPKVKGYFGEKSVSKFLLKLDPDKYKVINNLMLQIGDRTTQIDHIVVSNYGIFVIETKNYRGWITGNEYDDYWSQTIYKRKEKLHNPIKQNYGHIYALKEVLNDFNDLNFISIIVFSVRAEIKAKTKTDVIYSTNLVKTIKKYTEKSISDSNKELIFKRLEGLNVDNKENRKTHIQSINTNIKESKDKVKKDICPKCGGYLVARNGKYGTFKGCSNYPKCKFIVK